MANPTLEKENQYVVVPLVDFEELTETRTRYAILADHIAKVLDRGQEAFHGYSDGLFKAVIGYKEKEVKGEEKK